MGRISFLFFFISHTLFVFAQDTQVNFFNKKMKIDTNYIEDFSDRLVLRAFIKNKTNSLTLRNTETNEELIYKPNPSVSLGGGFNYNWLGLDLAFQLPEEEKTTDKYGRTKSFDFQSNMYLRKFSVDLSYVRYKGYYLEDSDDPLNGDTIIKNESLGTKTFGANINYIFNNKRFSYRAVYLQNERQKKSAGTFFTGGYFSSTGIHSGRGLIPKHYVDQYPELADLRRINSWQLGGQGGYAHTFVVKYFYVTLSFGFGVGVEHKKFANNEGESLATSYGVAPRYQMKGAIGYNGNNFSVGIQGVKDGLFVGGTGINEMVYSFGSFRFFVAHRFFAPKPIHFLKRLNPFKKNK